MRTTSRRWWRPLAILAISGWLGACATTPTGPSAGVEVPFPSPLSGPGHPTATATVRRHVDEGWRELLRGRYDAARARAARAGHDPAAKLLELQIETLQDPGAAVDGLQALTRSQPGYASAWITLSFAAERANEEATALAAARHAARLWGSRKWIERASQLEDRWVGSRLAEAEQDLDAGEGTRSAELARKVLAVDPGNRRATLVLARARLAQGDDAGALQAVQDLAGDPDALVIEATVAERRQRWSRAMELYRQLPDTDPRKKAALARVTRRWRIANLPEYVQAALRSPALTREQLAILVPNLLPELLALPPRNVPVISDIVDLPSQREIVTMVAAGLMRADPIEHTFDPQGAVSAARAREVLDGAIRLTGRKPPRWCEGDAAHDGCFVLSDPPTGHEVAAVLDAMEEVQPDE